MKHALLCLQPASPEIPFKALLAPPKYHLGTEGDGAPTLSY